MLISSPACTGGRQSGGNEKELVSIQPVSLFIIPLHPAQGEPFSVVAIGSENLVRSDIEIFGAEGSFKPIDDRNGADEPFWKVSRFKGLPAGRYNVSARYRNNVTGDIGFEITAATTTDKQGVVRRTAQGWNKDYESLYSVWVNALFQGCDESASWTALHEVTRDSSRNFLYNCLSLGEDKSEGNNVVLMQPDCADNPFFLRAYFSWKLGLPFGYHLCNRGYVNHSPETGKWVTNESLSGQSNPVRAFNSFLRMVADGVHSGTARTSLKDGSSDYYPVPLEKKDLRPGTVYADPYGHTLVLIGWILQKSGKPGVLLAVDAQPDGTVGIKRFWKGNFLFNTKDVVGEPGFKAFRPLQYKNGSLQALHNEALTTESGYIPFSLQQRKMEDRIFYHTMERIINPEPLDPESAMLDQITALHEQLQVRVTSVSNGENYMKSHPGTVIPMPSNATGIFLAGGQWENFSTPNRDLRLLIAIDAVESFPDRVAESPQDFRIRGNEDPEKIRKRLREILDKKLSELSITYTRSDGSAQKLSLAGIIARKDAFEVAYNPNDGVEIRWGAPENSQERSACHRHAPAGQAETMRVVRTWFHKRLHPPT